VNYLRTIFDCHSPTFAAPSTSQDMLGIPSAFAQDMLCARYSEFQLRLCYARISLENRKGGGSRSVLVRFLGSVIPAWSAGIQADMDVSGRILHTWMPAIHAGRTKLSIFMLCGRA
jgi:hypothetical protein